MFTNGSKLFTSLNIFFLLLSYQILLLLSLLNHLISHIELFLDLIFGGHFPNFPVGMLLDLLHGVPLLGIPAKKSAHKVNELISQWVIFSWVFLDDFPIFLRRILHQVIKMVFSGRITEGVGSGS